MPVVVFWMVSLALIGLLAGALVNHAVYTWCWYPRPISPWVAPRSFPSSSSPDQSVQHAATWIDRVPVLGWIGRHRSLTGLTRWGATRPVLIELGLAIALPWYYHFVCVQGGMLPVPQRAPEVIAAIGPALHWQFAAHAVLIVLMTAATFIDFDEQTIPDIITVPGTLLALTAATYNPLIYLPDMTVIAGKLHPVTYSLPWLPADPRWIQSLGLSTGLAIWTTWCFALAHRRVILRKGLRKAIEFFLAGLVRYPGWKFLLGMWVVGCIAVGVVWSIGGNPWTGLLTGLVGLAVGGGTVWGVRIVASAAMGVEAMGFGDVTLMAMIGSFVGWQASLAAFFLSPLAAIAIVLVQYAITRESRVPFGPYLCAGAMLTLVFWDPIYNGYLSPTLQMMGTTMLYLAVTMLALMGVLLFVWGQIKAAMFR